MHYGPRDFSINGADTIIPKGGRAIGQRRALSVGDILQTKLLYRCQKKGGKSLPVVSSSHHAYGKKIIQLESGYGKIIC